MVTAIVAIAYFGSLAYIAGKLVDKGYQDELVILMFLGLIIGCGMIVGISGVVKLDG